ncbi:lipid a biosynthesis lauroyl acyltransferase [hydrocarbon metagenome]|uniref:Lipid a biosynthesis lauroyl acyltransferase n=1 Tax=hydrocarbon metagenome TaxID=938273 RepID=A0A0W8FL66_9ZZZZ
MAVQPTTTTKIMLFVGHRIPLFVRKGVFIRLFMLFYHVGTKNRLITLHNLMRSFPEKDLKEIIKIAKGVYRHFATVAAEFFDMPYVTKETIHKWAEVEGLENYKAAIAKGKGILSIVAHFGNWEILPFGVPIYARTINIVYRPLDNPVIDNMVEYVRTMMGNTLIPKGGSGKRILELLKENQIVGLLSDQNVDLQEGVFVDFFGRPACTGKGLAVMAMRSGAPVIALFPARQKSGKYKAVITPAIEAVSTGDYQADILTNTQRFTKVIEDIVREYPEQWFWFHQRWKTKPYQPQFYQSREFYAQLEKEVETASLNQQPLTVMLIDIDKLKAFSDTYGHVEGEKTATKLYNLLKRCRGESYLSYWFGDDEFTMILPATAKEQGLLTAQKVQEELRKEVFAPESGKEVHVTVSIGLAQYKPEEDMKSFFYRVKKLMLQAKQEGRNRICAE